jgi:hypothetical protein
MISGGGPVTHLRRPVYGPRNGTPVSWTTRPRTRAPRQHAGEQGQTRGRPRAIHGRTSVRLNTRVPASEPAVHCTACIQKPGQVTISRHSVLTVARLEAGGHDPSCLHPTV